MHAKMKEEHNALRTQNTKLNDELRKKTQHCELLQTKLNEFSKKGGHRQITPDELEDLHLK
jgi:hypothetical protein